MPPLRAAVTRSVSPITMSRGLKLVQAPRATYSCLQLKADRRAQWSQTKGRRHFTSKKHGSNYHNVKDETLFHSRQEISLKFAASINSMNSTCSLCTIWHCKNIHFKSFPQAPTQYHKWSLQGARSLQNPPAYLPDRFRAHQTLKRAIEGIIQTPLKHWQARGINHFSGKPVPVLGHPRGKELFPNVQSEPPRHSFVPFPCALSSVTREQRPAPPPLLPLPRELQSTGRPGHLSASCSPGETTQASSASPHRTCLPALSPALLLSSGHFQGP